MSALDVADALEGSTSAELTVSVIMAVYRGDELDYLEACVRSLVTQTRAPDEVVVAIDGPGADRHAELLERRFAQTAIPLRMLRLPRNLGPGAARNAAARAANGDLLAIMDADDIAEPDRLARSVAAFRARPDVDVVTGWQAEFHDDSSKILAYKVPPSDPVALARALKWHCPVPNDAVTIRRSVFAANGGYTESLLFGEDWDLFVRLLRSGTRFQVIDAVLLRFRTAHRQRRRGGLRLVLLQYKLHWWWLKRGIFSPWHILAMTLLYTPFRLLLPEVRDRIYGAVRRRGPMHEVRP